MRRKIVQGRISGSLSKVAGLATVGLLFVSPQTAQAQEPESSGDTAQVYEREVFQYPTAGRRDPFFPLTAGQQIGPRFDDLELNGVLYNPTVGSVATLTDRKTGKRYRTRTGDSLGDIRVVAIRAEEVDFLITSFGISRRETLRVSKDKERQG